MRTKAAANKSIAASGAGRWSNRLQIAISSSFGLTNKAKRKLLTSTFKTKPSSSSGRDVIKSPTCSNTQSLLAMLMRHLLTIMILTICLVSCNRNQDNSSIIKQDKKIHERFFPITSVDTTLVYDFFSITVPNCWKKPNDDTLPKFTDATAYGRIQIGDNEFIWYSNGLGASDYSEFPAIIPTIDREIYIKNKLDTSYVIFSDNQNKVDKSRLKIHKTWVGQIEGHNTKFFEPIKLGFGYTGLYMDSVSEIKEVAKLNFALYADKLDSSTNAAFLKAMKTIKNFKSADF